jgi:Fe2+ or Zn2+ uptake regulation protein
VKEFEDRQLANIALRAAGKGFAVEAVSVEVFGHCSDCLVVAENRRAR